VSGYQVPANAIQAAIVTDSAKSIIVIYLTWPDQMQIVTVAEAVIAELTMNGSAYFPQVEGIEPAVRPVDAPAPVQMPPRLRDQLTGPAIRIGLALVVGVALSLMWHYLDPTVHEKAELEAMGLKVVAEIPRKK
jgi:hypothetical protein